MPNFEQIKWYEQVGSTDCGGLFAIAYAADILNGNNIYDLIYNQTKMREHLIACFEQRKITTFPLCEKRNREKVVTHKFHIFTREQASNIHHGTSLDLQLD